MTTMGKIKYLCRCLMSKANEVGVFDREDITDDYYYGVILSGDDDVKAFVEAEGREKLAKMSDDAIRMEWERAQELINA